MDKQQFKILYTILEYDMTTQVHPIFSIIGLYNYIKDSTTEEIDYFEEEIDEEMIPVFISNNLSFGTSLAISTVMTWSRGQPHD